MTGHREVASCTLSFSDNEKGYIVADKTVRDHWEARLNKHKVEGLAYIVQQYAQLKVPVDMSAESKSNPKYVDNRSWTDMQWWGFITNEGSFLWKPQRPGLRFLKTEDGVPPWIRVEKGRGPVRKTYSFSTEFVSIVDVLGGNANYQSFCREFDLAASIDKCHRLLPAENRVPVQLELNPDQDQWEDQKSVQLLARFHSRRTPSQEH